MLLPAPNSPSSNVATVLWSYLDKVGVGVCHMPSYLLASCLLVSLPGVARPLGVCFIVIGISVAMDDRIREKQREVEREKQWQVSPKVWMLQNVVASASKEIEIVKEKEAMWHAINGTIQWISILRFAMLLSSSLSSSSVSNLGNLFSVEHHPIEGGTSTRITSKFNWFASDYSRL